MGRLTNKHGSKCKACTDSIRCNNEVTCIDEQIYQRLKHYEDLEEAGRLIEQKRGIWIRTGAISYRCSECNYLPLENDTAFCPNCGAKMELKELEGKDTNVPSKWIPCSERLPDELTPVNVTWVNRKPTPYYENIKNIPFTATAVYCNKKWFWWSSICEDILAEYGRNDAEMVDEFVDIIAWMPLPPAFEGE